MRLGNDLGLTVVASAFTDVYFTSDNRASVHIMEITTTSICETPPTLCTHFGRSQPQLGGSDADAVRASRAERSHGGFGGANRPRGPAAIHGGRPVSTADK